MVSLRLLATVCVPNHCLPLRYIIDIGAGTYKVSLDWEMAEGAHAIVFAQPDVVLQ
jgi:hypothetical protein